jgi:hypothetical protein
MGFLSRILGIDKLKQEIWEERVELEILKETLHKKYDNLIQFSRISLNTDIAELRLAIRELEKRIEKIEKEMSEKEIVIEGYEPNDSKKDSEEMERIPNHLD